jgi:perosamine synthetase
MGGKEWEYMRECIDTNMVSSVGPFVGRFEHDLARRLGIAHAVATVTGTAAIHTALVVAGVGAGDEVVVSTLTFIAPVNAVRYIGAIPVLADAEPEYWEMDPNWVVDFLDNSCVWRNGSLYNRVTGRRIAAVMPVHILGHPVSISAIVEAARRYQIPVIEDATESLGAEYNQQPVGTFGDMACFSFNGNKLITTGGGGMIVTNDAAMAERAKYLTTQAKDDALEFIHGTVGFNYRLTNVAAAMGCAQLEVVDDYIARKRRIAARYREAFAPIPGLRFMREAPSARSVWWLSTILVDKQVYGRDSRALLRICAAAGISTRPLWQPAHRSPALADLPLQVCPVADALNADALSLPSSVGLSEDEQERVIAAIAGAAADSGTV